MKLSERLRAIEDEDAKPTPEAPSPSPARRRTTPIGTTKAPTKRPARTTSDVALDEAKRKAREVVLEELAPRVGALQGDALAAEVRALVDRVASGEDVRISVAERRRFVQELLDDILGYGPLEALLDDESITEIMCNAHDDVWVEREGRLVHTDVTFVDDARYRAVIQRIVSAIGRRVDESSPMVDARLPDGSRVNVVVPPLAIGGPIVTIRKFAADPLQAKDLVAFGTWTMDLALVLEAAVRGKLNILVSGGTDTGKTTNLNVLSSFIPEGERVVTIEDAAELQLQQPHVLTLETRPANAEGAGEVRVRDLVRNALRMRPDRIVVGEVRGGEALDMLQAMNTGHEGSMTTMHANSPRDALSRLETMVLMAGYDLPSRAIREQIVSAIQLIMHLDRLPDGRRVVTALTEVHGLEGDTILLQDVFRHRNLARGADGVAKGELQATGLRPRMIDQLAEREVDIPLSVFRAPDAPATAAASGTKLRSVARQARP